LRFGKDKIRKMEEKEEGEKGDEEKPLINTWILCI
jgi:hypothetical protein